MPAYRSKFYETQAARLAETARTVIPRILDQVAVRSVIDVGCGTGVWLETFRELGVTDVFGTDVHREIDLLRIPAGLYRDHDLTEPLVVDRRFDLAVCIEVAEHLPESHAETLLASLTGLSDVILLSAAIPGQGGHEHLNEQWPAYWAEKMLARGYMAFDTLRPVLWNAPGVRHWVAQNAIFYVNARGLAANPGFSRSFSFGNGIPPALVHPGQLAAILAQRQQAGKKGRGKRPGATGQPAPGV